MRSDSIETMRGPKEIRNVFRARRIRFRQNGYGTYNSSKPVHLVRRSGCDQGGDDHEWRKDSLWFDGTRRPFVRMGRSITSRPEPMKPSSGRARSAATLAATALCGLAVMLLPGAPAYAQKTPVLSQGPAVRDGTPEIDASIAQKNWNAALTQLDLVLRRLPRGLDEPLGPLGAKLSGGEKKRLALARTLLQQPRILIVDEITSSLDAPSATALLHGLEHFRRSRTLVVVSHRPSTILWADRILVVEDGAIVDSGRHGDLILRCQAYRRIWQSQDYETPPVFDRADSPDWSPVSQEAR